MFQLNSASTSPRRLPRLFSLLLLGVLLGGAVPPATAVPSSAPATAQVSSDYDIHNRQHRRVVRAVRRDLSERTSIPRRQLRLTSFSAATWSDSCLGLGGIAELCAQALVDGWRVAMSDGEQTWVYRTNAAGTVIRAEESGNAPIEQPSATLPDAIARIVRQAAARQSGLPLSQLTIADAEQRYWNGCLGIQPPGTACTEIAISGWRVTVTDGQQRWVYHTNADGSDIRFNEAESQSGSALIPTPIPISSLPASLEQGVLFRTIASGGITGSTSITTLYEDGRVVQQTVTNATVPPRSATVSREQVDQFRRLLIEQRFDRFNALSYAAPTGAADYITVQLIGPNGVTQYADLIQNQLPDPLQQVIQSWQAIANPVLG